MYRVKRFSIISRVGEELKKNPVATAALLVSTSNAANNIAKANRENKLIREKKSLLDSLKGSTKKKKKDDKNLNIIYL